MPSSLPRAHRRTALGMLLAGTAVAGSSALTGCGLDLLDRSSEEPVPTAPGAASTAESERSDDEVDTDIREQALTAIDAALGLTLATTTAHPGLSGALGPVTAVHRSHVDLLASSRTGEGSESLGAAPEPRVRARSARALREVRRHENDLQVLLATLAAEARSGPFARVLASMSAAVGQQVLVLPRPGRAGTP